MTVIATATATTATVIATAAAADHVTPTALPLPLKLINIIMSKKPQYCNSLVWLDIIMYDSITV